LAVAVTLCAVASGTAGCVIGDECAGSPTITSFTATPTTVAAGEQVSTTLSVENFTIGHDEHGHDGHTHGCTTGHAHIYLDDLMTNPLAMPMKASASVTIPADTEPGKHELIARLHGSDHKILEPQVKKTVVIEVK